jgi:hypothetical protein
MQVIKCKECKAELAYIKGDGIYSIKPGEKYTSWTRVDGFGNPINKKEVNRRMPDIEWGDTRICPNCETENLI